MARKTAPASIPEMRRSWLVQRLQKPISFGQFADNPFSFGGGLRNGGLSGDAMAALRGIFSFDYMGAAEFEWGAVPEALQGLARNASQLVAFSFEIDLSTVPSGWRDDQGPGVGTETVYALCRSPHRQEVQKRIVAWSAKQFPELKESLNFTTALRPRDEWDVRTAGWLELDNGFFFFTDYEMWSKTCELFGVPVPVGA